MKPHCNHLSIGAPGTQHIRWQSAADFIAGQTTRFLDTIMARRISPESARKAPTPTATAARSSRLALAVSAAFYLLAAISALPATVYCTNLVDAVGVASGTARVTFTPKSSVPQKYGNQTVLPKVVGVNCDTNSAFSLNIIAGGIYTITFSPANQFVPPVTGLVPANTNGAFTLNQIIAFATNQNSFGVTNIYGPFAAGTNVTFRTNASLTYIDAAGGSGGGITYSFVNTNLAAGIVATNGTQVAIGTNLTALVATNDARYLAAITNWGNLTPTDMSGGYVAGFSGISWNTNGGVNSGYGVAANNNSNRFALFYPTRFAVYGLNTVSGLGGGVNGDYVQIRVNNSGTVGGVQPIVSVKGDGGYFRGIASDNSTVWFQVDTNGIQDAFGLLPPSTSILTNAAAFAPNTVTNYVLPSNLVTLNTLNGNALTNLNSSSLTGILPMGTVATGFTNASGAMLITNNGARWYSYNAAALTNYASSNLSGVIPSALLPAMNYVVNTNGQSRGLTNLDTLTANAFSTINGTNFSIGANGNGIVGGIQFSNGAVGIGANPANLGFGTISCSGKGMFSGGNFDTSCGILSSSGFSLNTAYIFNNFAGVNLALFGRTNAWVTTNNFVSGGTITATNGYYYPSNSVTAATITAGFANGAFWMGTISNSLQCAWMSNNVVNWKQIAP